MGRQLLFWATPSPECLRQMAEFCQPLLLSDYRGHSPWIQDTFQELQLKFRFIRFVISLDLQNSHESQELKQTIVKRFWKDWETDPTTLQNRVQTRRLSRGLWTGLLSLLTQTPPHLNTISFVHTTVDSILEQDNSANPMLNFSHAIELAGCCLVLTGLVLCQQQPPSMLGSKPPKWFNGRVPFRTCSACKAFSSSQEESLVIF
jgi:hypothetical protein